MITLCCLNACSGSVTAPTLQFDVPKLEFGTVSYGKRILQFCSLNIELLVHMTVKSLGW